MYEEETNNVFEDRSDEILEHSTTARLLSFPNVVITSHQGFFTKEALAAIAGTTLENAMDFQAGKESANDVKPSAWPRGTATAFPADTEYSGQPGRCTQQPRCRQRGCWLSRHWQAIFLAYCTRKSIHDILNG